MPLSFATEQDKLADVHLTVTPIHFAIFPSSPSSTSHHPPKRLLAYCKTKGVMNQTMLLNHAIMPSISDQG